MDGSEDRRSHQRVGVRTTVTCKRVGHRSYDEDVVSMDLSAGGAMLLADDRLGVGDVVALTIPVEGMAVDVKGLVVAVREAPESPDGAAFVHVAFTGMKADRQAALARYLDGLQPTTA